MCKNIIYNYTLLVTNIRLFIRQTKKHTLFNAQIDQINHCISASKYWYESLLSIMYNKPNIHKQMTALAPS